MTALSGLLDALATAPDHLVVLVAGLVALLEASAFVGLVVPGETVVLLAGAITAGDGPPLPVVIGVVTAGSVLGDSLGYLVGRRLGPGLRSSQLGRRLRPERWAAADRAVAGAGGRTVALARFVGVAHAVTPAVAGMAGMPYRRFLVASATGSSLWATGYVVVGRATGGSWGQLDGRLRLALPAAAVTLLLGSALLLWRRRLKPAAAPAAAGARPVAGEQPAVVEVVHLDEVIDVTCERHEGGTRRVQVAAAAPADPTGARATRRQDGTRWEPHCEPPSGGGQATRAVPGTVWRPGTVPPWRRPCGGSASGPEVELDVPGAGPPDGAGRTRTRVQRRCSTMVGWSRSG